MATAKENTVGLLETVRGKSKRQAGDEKYDLRRESMQSLRVEACENGAFPWRLTIRKANCHLTSEPQENRRGGNHGDTILCIPYVTSIDRWFIKINLNRCVLRFIKSDL